MIIPTVGRIVWYTPFETDLCPIWREGDQPLAAIITYAWSDTCVNLAVFNQNGKSFGKTSVLLVQDDAPRPARGFCEWMPYQKGQAAKYEALAAQVQETPSEPS